MHRLGRFCYHLSVACWQQSNLAEAQLNNNNALALGCDKNQETQSRNQRARQHAQRGDLSAAQETSSTTLRLVARLQLEQVATLALSRRVTGAAPAAALR